MTKKSHESGNSSPFWLIERCRDCSNAVIDLGDLAENIAKVLKELDFETKRREVLKTDQPSHHQVFRISLAGCPNSCSQPQIKDVGIQGQAVPAVGDGCTHCGECVVACPDGAIVLSGGGPVIDRDSCLNCGRCARACPTGILIDSGRGYRVLVGGKLGRRPRLADTAVALGDERAVETVIRKAAGLLTDEKHASKRLGSVLDEMGDKCRWEDP